MAPDISVSALRDYPGRCDQQVDHARRPVEAGNFNSFDQLPFSNCCKSPKRSSAFARCSATIAWPLLSSTPVQGAGKYAVEVNADFAHATDIRSGDFLTNAMLSHFPQRFFVAPGTFRNRALSSCSASSLSRDCQRIDRPVLITSTGSREAPLFEHAMPF